MTQSEQPTFATRVVHAGERQDFSRVHPVVGPIHPSVGYTFADARELDAVLGGEQSGFVYSTRYANPTVAALETAVAELEGGEAAHAFASGMAAIHMALLAAGVRAGASVVAAADIYGATYTLLQDLLATLGADIHFVDVTNLDAVSAAVTATQPVVLFVETMSNPLIKMADLPRLADIAHQHDARLLVDNTFCTPYLCRPLTCGADVVIHSATKYLAGHGDVMAGVVVGTADFKEKLLALTKLVGSTLGPFEAWLLHRGLKTLALRMDKQCASAQAIAERLQKDSRIGQVHYAGLRDHPQRPLLQQLTGGRAGGVLSFVIKDAGRAEVFTFMDALQLIQPATTLGDIYSLLLYPAISPHRTLTAVERQTLGISDGLVRLAVGIEDPEDIWADLDRALG